MNDSEVVLALRKRIFDDWRLRRFDWREVKYKYGFSKAWFYKWLGRYLRYGEAGLKNVVSKSPLMPHRLRWDQELSILDYIYNHPTHGPDRIGREQNPKISGHAVWNYLVRTNLNTRRKRRLWAEAQGKSVLTTKEKQRMQAKFNHVEAKEAGELVGMDTFVVCVKGLGKLCQYTTCDNYSSYGWAKVYTQKTADNAVDFFVNHKRRHTGYKLKAGGFEFPGHAFFDIREKSNIIEIKY